MDMITLAMPEVRKYNPLSLYIYISLPYDLWTYVNMPWPFTHANQAELHTRKEVTNHVWEVVPKLSHKEGKNNLKWISNHCTSSKVDDGNRKSLPDFQYLNLVDVLLQLSRGQTAAAYLTQNLEHEGKQQWHWYHNCLDMRYNNETDMIIIESHT